MASQFKDTNVTGQLTANRIILNNRELKIPSSSAELDTNIEDDLTNSTFTPTAKQVRDYIQSKSVTNTHSISLESSDITNVVLGSENTGIKFKYTATAANEIDHTGWIVKENDITDWNEVRQSTKFISELTIPNTAGVENFSRLTINGTVGELLSGDNITGMIQSYKANLRLSNSDSTAGTITLQNSAFLNTFTGNGTIVNFDGGSSNKDAITNYTNAGRIKNMTGSRSITNFGEDSENGAARIAITSFINGEIDVDWAQLSRAVSGGNVITVPANKIVNTALLNGTVGTASGSAVINSFTGSYTFKSGLVDNIAPGTITLFNNSKLGMVDLKSASSLSNLNNAGTISIYSGTGIIDSYTNTGAIATMTGTRTIAALGTSNYAGGVSITDNSYGTVSIGAGDRSKVGIINIGSTSATSTFARVDGYGISIGGTRVTNNDPNSANAGKLIQASPSFTPGIISGRTDIDSYNIEIGSNDASGLKILASATASATSATWNATTAGWLNTVSANTSSNTNIGDTSLTASETFIQSILIKEKCSLGSADKPGVTIADGGDLYTSGKGHLHNSCTNLFLEGPTATIKAGSQDYSTATGSLYIPTDGAVSVIIENNGKLYAQPSKSSGGVVYNKCSALYLDGDSTRVYCNASSHTGVGAVTVAAGNRLGVNLPTNATLYLNGWSISDNGTTITFA